MKAIAHLVIVILFLTEMPSCFADSLGYWDLKTSYALAAVVARVEIVSVSAIKFDKSDSDVCGYRIQAHVKDLFKGESGTKDFIFYSETNDDILNLEDHEEYLIIANPRASASSETVLEGRKCDTRGILFAVNSTFQTVFPIRNNSYDGVSGELMISRHSPFTTSNAVGLTSDVTGFVIIKNRIYAIVALNKVVTDLNTWRANPPKLSE